MPKLPDESCKEHEWDNCCSILDEVYWRCKRCGVIYIGGTDEQAIHWRMQYIGETARAGVAGTERGIPALTRPSLVLSLGGSSLFLVSSSSFLKSETIAPEVYLFRAASPPRPSLQYAIAVVSW